VIGLSGETGMSPHTVIAQTKELLHFFLERGADVNLQTADAGRTVFHMVLAAEVTDGELVEQMVTMGALVNLTDVHGTTPLMDVIRCSAKERGSETYKSLGKLDKVSGNLINLISDRPLFRYTIFV
jgi:ankyrin repeat protein